MTVSLVDAQPLVEAIKASITGIEVSEGARPTVDAGMPYVVAWFDAGRVTDKSLRSRDGYELTAVFHCYGGNPDAVRFAVGKVRAAVLDLSDVTVDGRTVQLPSQQSAPPMQRDDDVQPALWWQTEVWTFRTSPA